MFAAISSTALRTVLGTVGTIVFAGTCLIGATAPAVAAPAATPRTQVIAYGDLNLSSAQGREKFDFRIRRAAKTVCDNGSDDLRARTDENRCILRAVAAARTDAAHNMLASKN